MRPLLADWPQKHAGCCIAFARCVQDLLAIRRNHALFRLRTAADINNACAFPIPAQSKGPVVLVGHPLDNQGCSAALRELLYFASMRIRWLQDITLPEHVGKAYQLPVQGSRDGDPIGACVASLV
jgi:hypothetical protein